MQPPERLKRVAAALFAAALVLLLTACDDEDRAVLEPSQTATDSKSPGTSAEMPSRFELRDDSGVIEIAGETADDLLTGSASLALGDFNDDSEPDLLVGASQGDGPGDGRTDSGEAYVLFGPLDAGRELGTGKADITITGQAAGDGLGYSVLAADINGDEVDDILVGAPGATAGFDLRTDQGRVYAFFGGSEIDERGDLDLATDQFDFTLTGAEGFSRLGAVMAAGDVNDDGIGDLVAGAPFAGREPGSPPGSQRTALGEVYVVFGNEGLSGEKSVARLEQDVLISGAHPFGEFGGALAVGDVNGDGRDDITIGAHRSNLGDEARGANGAAYLFLGRDEFPERLSAQDGDEDMTILGRPPGAFGLPVTSGDFNGDTLADIAIGAQLEGAGDEQGGGTIRIFFGRSNLQAEVDLSQDEADVTLIGQMRSELLPSALASADLDQDGTDELVIGSMLVNADDQRFGSGGAYVVSVHSSPSGVIQLPDSAMLVVPPGGDERFGNAVAAGEIVSGATGIAVVAPGASPGDRRNAGIVYLTRLGQ